MPVPSFTIHVMVAAAAVAVSSPTPYPFNTACVARVLVIEEQNAYNQQKHINYKYIIYTHNLKKHF